MKMSRFKLTFLLIGIMLAMMQCSPPPFNYLTVNKVIVVDNIPYIYAYLDYGDSLAHKNGDDTVFYVSNDDGVTWQEATPVGFDNPSIILDLLEVQKTMCAPNDNQVCYRISGKEYIEISRNGGQEWQIDWALPAGRKDFMERNPTFPPFWKSNLSSIPTDLGIVEKGSTHLVIAAMGNQGVLVKDINGNWNRYAIVTTKEYFSSATPFPYNAVSIKESVESTANELYWISFLAALYLTILSFSAWSGIRKWGDPKYRTKIILAFLPFPILVILFLLFCYSIFVLYISPGYIHAKFGLAISNMTERLFQMPWLLIVVPVLGILISWIVLIRSLPARRTTFTLFRTVLGFSMILWVILYIPFFLWAFGIIPIYSISLVIAVILGITITIFEDKVQKPIFEQVISDLQARTPARPF